MARIFVYDQREFPDPDPSLSIDQVKAMMTDFFPELANADTTHSKRKSKNQNSKNRSA